MSLVTGSDRPSRPGVKLTYDDFVLFPDDGKRHELIDGEHYVTPSPNLKHQAVCGNLHGRIWNYLQERQIGKVSSTRTSTSCASTACRTASIFARRSSPSTTAMS